MTIRSKKNKNNRKVGNIKIVSFIMFLFCLFWNYFDLFKIASTTTDLEYNYLLPDELIQAAATMTKTSDKNNSQYPNQRKQQQPKQQQQQNIQYHQKQQQEESKHQGLRRLEFIHIPKTGGTVIESVAGKNGIGWGVCHFYSSKAVFKMSRNAIRCPSSSSSSSSNEHQKGGNNPSSSSSSVLAAWKNTRNFHTLTSWWHLPPSYFFNDDYVSSINNNTNAYLPINPYDGAADLFAIVRNPYERIISEYYFQHTYFKNGKIQKVNNVRYLNEWITKKLETDYSQVYLNKNAKRYLYDRTNNSTAAYLIDDGHFIPQVDYIYDNSMDSSYSITTIANGDDNNGDDKGEDNDDDGNRTAQPPMLVQQQQQQQSQHTYSNNYHRRSTSKRKRIVDHVLKFETLHDDLHSLINKYGLPYNKLIPLPKERMWPLDKKLGLYNLTFENVQLIERIYMDDFDEFDYTIQSTKIPNDILERNSKLMG